jgi:tetratricopeptide (TPR) repeat protein
MSRMWSYQLVKTGSDVLEEALLLRQQGDPTEALDRLKIALEMEPNNADALFMFGSLTEDMGDYDTALSYYNRALEVNENHAAALVAKGSILRDLGDVDAASSLFDAAILL